ncbi:MAG TPA: rhomboid family intramembrane serine protease [Gemmatimonadaceae bacterium]|nr:rhomboid family intramembrane serine protease [Gemmatimonadaceae bacterium]
MIPLGDNIRPPRRPVMTYLLLAGTWAVWLLVQQGGFDPQVVAQTVCNLGMVPGEITHRVPVGFEVPIGPGMACVIDNDRINVFTPLLSIFLHGGWGHIIGNSIYLLVFGKNVEGSMGAMRFLVFYLVCGLVAAASHIAINPTSAVPTVGASGAISGILGGYLVLFPHARIRMYFPPIFFFSIPAVLVLLFWFGEQLLTGLPQLSAVDRNVMGGVAVWAHVGGFLAGALLVRLFTKPSSPTTQYVNI